MAASEPALAARERAAEFLLRRHRLRAAEVLPWLAAVLAYFAFPGHLVFGTQLLIMVLFALSLDLILGYAGIVSLGHAAFFGTGAYTAGLFSKFVWGEPLTGLFVGAAAAALLGYASSFVIARFRHLTLI